MLEKWRYKLPCGHHTIQYRSSKERYGKDAIQSAPEHKLYYCKECNEHHEYKIDKKENKKVYA